MLTFASFVTTPIDALRILSTLLNMPSASKKGRTICMAWLASEISVKDASQSLIVNEVTERHNLSPEVRTVSFMSSMARNAADHNFFKCFPTYTSKIQLKDITMQQMWWYSKDAVDRKIWTLWVLDVSDGNGFCWKLSMNSHLH